jgi:hypothetical protein
MVATTRFRKIFKKLKGSYHISLHAAVFLLLLLLFFINALLYEGIMMGTINFGSLLDSMIIGLAALFHFPFNTIFKPSSDVLYFLGLFINLNLYAFLIYRVTKGLFNWLRKK